MRDGRSRSRVISSTFSLFSTKGSLSSWYGPEMPSAAISCTTWREAPRLAKALTSLAPSVERNWPFAPFRLRAYWPSLRWPMSSLLAPWVLKSPTSA